MTITLTVWRQAGPQAEGRFETYEVHEVSPDTPVVPNTAGGMRHSICVIPDVSDAVPFTVIGVVAE